MKAAIYTRVSSPGQATADAASLEAQERIARELSAREGAEVVEHYQDAGRSATKDSLDNRPAMVRLLADAAAGRFDCLAVYHQDRLARQTEVSAQIALTLRQAGVTVLTPGGPLDLVSFGGKLMYYVGALMAEDEARRIRERCDRDKRRYAERGDFVMWQTCFGYRWKPGDVRRGVPNTLVPIADELGLVRELFQLADEGRTARQITALLNERHCHTRSGGKWFPSGITRILRDERYCGRWPAWKNTPDGSDTQEVYYVRDELVPEVAVSSEQWRRVQAALSHHRRRTRRPMKHAFLLNGFLYCADCGSPMVGHAIGGKGEGAQRYYQCTKKATNEGHACRGRYVPAAPLEAEAWALVEELASRPEAAAGYAWEARDESLPADREELARLEALVAGHEGKLDSFIRLRAAGEITAEELTKHRAQLAADREAWEERAADLRRRIADEEATLYAAQKAAGMASEAAAALDLQGRRWWLRQLSFRMELSCEDWSAKAKERRYDCDFKWAGTALLAEAGRDYVARSKARWM